MFSHRVLLKPPAYSSLTDECKLLCERIDQRVLQLDRRRAPRHPADWLHRASSRVTHPLAAHAVDRNGLPEFRSATCENERAALLTLGVRLVATARSGCGTRLGSALQEAARAAGCYRAILRSTEAISEPDAAGVSVHYPPAKHVGAQLSYLAEILRDNACSPGYNAIVAQAIVLNLHPLNDGNGRASRLLWNALLWGEDGIAWHFIPLYALRKHAPYSFEICIRAAELHGNWRPLLQFHTELIDCYANEILQ